MPAACSFVTLLLATSLAGPSFGQSTQAGAVRARLADLAWLAGSWTGPAGPLLNEEHWTEPAGGAMLAVARTIKGERMVAFEFLRIVERDDTLVYIAQPNGRPPTEFVLHHITATSAVFTNPAHDFPKEVRYTRKEDGTLEAVVSDGAGKAQVFRLKKS